jgi:hypothetical protein
MFLFHEDYLIIKNYEGLKVEYIGLYIKRAQFWCNLTLGMRVRSLSGAICACQHQRSFHSIFEPYFPYFKKVKAGLCDHHAVCVCVFISPINF